ncbi:MAG: hypothetical protein MHM6MM_004111 [Cercozoa sp. M6MM]
MARRLHVFVDRDARHAGLERHVASVLHGEVRDVTPCATELELGAVATRRACELASQSVSAKVSDKIVFVLLHDSPSLEFLRQHVLEILGDRVEFASHRKIAGFTQIALPKKRARATATLSRRLRQYVSRYGDRVEATITGDQARSPRPNVTRVVTCNLVVTDDTVTQAKVEKLLADNNLETVNTLARSKKVRLSIDV